MTSHGRAGKVREPSAAGKPAPLDDDVADILDRAHKGDAQANEELFTRLYGILRALAHSAMLGQSPSHTLEPTALVNEVFLKLKKRRGGWESRAHFLAVAARAMRCVLIDHARTKTRQRRTATGRRIDLDAVFTSYEKHSADLLAVDEALRRLAAQDERAARVVELRFFGGLALPTVARVLGIPLRTVERDWAWARAWLHAELA